jgi:hypothetical protein
MLDRMGTGWLVEEWIEEPKLQYVWASGGGVQADVDVGQYVPS